MDKRLFTFGEAGVLSWIPLGLRRQNSVTCRACYASSPLQSLRGSFYCFRF